MNFSGGVWQLLNELSAKAGITEVVINNEKNVFVEREGKFIQLKVSLTKDDLYQFIRDVSEFNHKKCDEVNPLLDGSLPDGSRINIVCEPLAKGAPAITIRKYLKRVKNFEQDSNIFGLNTEWVHFLKSMIKARCNLIISGGTGVGKTTFINLLSNEIGPAERVVTIEDTIELQFNLPNIVRLESFIGDAVGRAKITTRDLVKNALRMRPDRIIIGEVRSGEMYDLLQAMNTGHDGSMSSIHANGPKECLSRMESLYLQSGNDVPYHVVRRTMVDAIDFLIQLGRDRNGNRIVTNISELVGMEQDTILLQTIASVSEGKLIPSGMVPTIINKLVEQGGYNRTGFI